VNNFEQTTLEGKKGAKKVPQQQQKRRFRQSFEENKKEISVCELSLSLSQQSPWKDFFPLCC
jgi:hypothetical protein